MNKSYFPLSLLTVAMLASCGSVQYPSTVSDQIIPSATTVNGGMVDVSPAELPGFLAKNPGVKTMLQKAGALDEILNDAASKALNVQPQQAVPYPITGCSLVITAQYDSVGKRVYSWGDMTCTKIVTSGYIELTTGQVAPSVGPKITQQFNVRGPTRSYTTRPGGVSAPVIPGGQACTQAYAFMAYSDGGYGAGVSPQNACDTRPNI
jgi:hypothetical protein